MAVRGGKTLTIFLAADLKNFAKGTAQAQAGLKGLSGTFKNLLGPAAIGAGIAVAGLATKLAVDGVKAAAEDEVSLAKLVQTLDNLKLAHSTEEIDTFIDALEQSVGFLGDLRPAYDRLIRSTKNATEANDLLTLSLDVSAGTGKSVEAVAEALGKAYDGNTAGLARLGAGIDRVTLASGDMNRITGVLAETFGGQASAQADTLNGRMQKLQRAGEQLTEAFGVGLLGGIESLTEGTDGLVTKMENLEPAAKAAGAAIGSFGAELVTGGLGMTKYVGFLTNFGATFDNFVESYAISIALALGQITKEESKARFAANDLRLAQELAGGAIEDVGNDAIIASVKLRDYDASIRMTTAGFTAFLNANKVSLNVIKETNKTYVDAAQRQKDINKFTYEYVDTALDAARASGTASSAIEKLTDKEKELTKTYEATSTSLASNRTALAFYTGELTKANDAITAFTTSMQANLMAGIDLGAAFAGQFDDAGKATGVSLLAGFNKQIDEAKYFGNVLAAIKAQGGDTALIEQIASLGPATGAALGQQMLDEGLVPTLNEKFLGVQEATKTLAMGLVPEFLVAGQESALTMIDTISETMSRQVTQLAKIGKKIAKPLGQSFKAQLLTDVAAAIAEVEAAGTAARAEARATVERRQVNLTNAAVAAALQNLVRSADARNGAPVTPVNR